jgi:5-(carboxyamino)imidazole ribonucleotide mutase
VRGPIARGTWFLAVVVEIAKYATPPAARLRVRPRRGDVAVRKANRSTRARKRSKGTAPRVAILMGSASDWDVMKAAADVLSELGIASDVRVISAHRTPARHHAYVTDAERRGIEVIIAGAGGAAHLAGVTAALTLLPVLGVPIDSSPLQGLDALLATVQMPGGIPVGTLAIGKAGAKNAALLAAAILARKDPALRTALARQRAKQTASVPERP